MKTLCEYLREHAIRLINFEKKKTNRSRNQMKMQKYVIFLKKNLKVNM